MSFNTGPVENSRFPWYKERLQTKYLRDLSKNQQLSGALDGRSWRFLSPGQDDFRDGYPTVHKALFTQCKCGTSPAVFGMPKHACSVKLPSKKLSKDQACYSKQNPQCQAQREFIDAVEYKLKQHPLAIYPHLESGMTPELFEQVLSVLDPDMCVNGELATAFQTKELEHLVERRPQCEMSAPDFLIETAKPSITIKPQKGTFKETRPANPYKWQEPRDPVASVKHLQSLSQEDDKLMITRPFCEWMTSLGGETNDLTESTILDLFKSDYEKKTFLVFPINKTDPYKTLAKLDSSVEEHHKDQSLETCFKELNKADRPDRPQTSKSWKKKVANVPLRTPSDISESVDIEEQLSEQDKELKQIHIMQAFREFIISKGRRMPRFLSAVFSDEDQDQRFRHYKHHINT
ncbi:protein FAM47E isoform X1 [Xyrauchen texanus]|uniref:protein FAM47E isoform X1 n=1 Tax=Xyrauchen texanus TaxID=154827 RepID=UPI002242416D|nr:protein FAM47E isoform X1 [Xyrauchen texanus]